MTTSARCTPRVQSDSFNLHFSTSCLRAAAWQPTRTMLPLRRSAARGAVTLGGLASLACDASRVWHFMTAWTMVTWRPTRTMLARHLVDCCSIMSYCGLLSSPSAATSSLHGPLAHLPCHEPHPHSIVRTLCCCNLPARCSHFAQYTGRV